MIQDAYRTHLLRVELQKRRRAKRAALALQCAYRRHAALNQLKSLRRAKSEEEARTEAIALEQVPPGNDRRGRDSG